MITKTEKITNINMNFKEAQKIARELTDKYSQLYNEANTKYEKTEDYTDENNYYFELRHHYFMLYSYTLRIALCTRRSIKMIFNLENAIKEAQKAGIKIL